MVVIYVSALLLSFTCVFCLHLFTFTYGLGRERERERERTRLASQAVPDLFLVLRIRTSGLLICLLQLTFVFICV